MPHTPTPTPPDNGDGDIDIDIDFPIDELVAVLIDELSNLLFGPFKEVGEGILEFLIGLITYTPAVHPNPAVASVHHDLLLIAYAIFGVALMATGLLYMAGPIIGVTYEQARMTIPRLFVAILFATVSPYLLQIAVDGTIALTQAVAPTGMRPGFLQILGFSTGLVLIWIIKAVLLLAVAALFIIRDIYILFVAAISPLLAIAWAFPKARRYADTFISGWFAALLIAPLDALVLRFVLAMMEPSLELGFVPRWLLGVAGLTLLIIAPWQLYGASQSIVGPAYMLARQGKHSTHRRFQQWRGQNGGGDTSFEEQVPDRVNRSRENPYRGYVEQERRDQRKARGRDDDQIW